MSRKEEAVNLIKKKMNGETFLGYKEIAEVTGYHPKYICRLKKEIINGTVQMVHGNKNRKPVNTISEEEKAYIIKLYKRSNASIRQFCNFYNRRSYSCIYNILKGEGLVGLGESKKKKKKKTLKRGRKPKRKTTKAKRSKINKV